MPHATLKLLPGVDQNRTITLNEAAISECQLVRFVPDKQGVGLVQKLGGWLKFPIDYQTSGYGTYNSTIRALWAWEDTNAKTHLGVGCQERISATLGTSGDGTTATITTDGTVVFNVGDSIAVDGVVPTDYNGTYTVSAVTSNTVSFASTATGSQTTAGTIYSGDGLSVITVDSANTASPVTRTFLTPKAQEANVPVLVQTVAGSNQVTINATNSVIFSTDTVYIETQISVGGLILFGLYQCYYINPNSFYIYATDAIGNPQLATSTVGSPGGGVVPKFTFINNDFKVNVTLPNNGYSIGDTFTALVPLTSSGITIYGNYTIQSIIDANTFQIFASNQANASNANVPLNSGNARYIYYKTPGALPVGQPYGLPTTQNYGNPPGSLYGYGTEITQGFTGNYIFATDWTLDNWGQIFIACPIGGSIYTWNPSAGVNQASIIPTCPPANDGIFVAMPQQQIIAWGSTFTGILDPLLIRWSDVGDYNVWTANPLTNQAGSYRLPKGSKIVGCIQGPQQGLVWTDLGVWAMQYSGPPYVYQFNEVGSGCGLIARKAATAMNGVVYWMSQSQFYKLGNNGVEIITCPIWDVIFQDLDTTNLDKIRIAANSRFGEVAWYYPTISNGGEVSKYAKYNVNLNVWDFGELTRTAWINQSVLGPPIGAGPLTTKSIIYQHETSKNADQSPMISYFQTGYFALSDGEYKVFVDQVWPDMKWNYYGQEASSAQINLTFYVSDYPGNAPRQYSFPNIQKTTEYVTPRFRGRLMSIRMQSNDYDSFWRIGAPRYRIQQDGKF